jgi:hypothetical protein
MWNGTTLTLKSSDIEAGRLHALGLSTPSFERAEDVVAHLVAMQAQDYAGAKWAVGARMRPDFPPAILSDAGLERALDDGRILRTHLLRPTWHFVTPADIRWILALSAPRIMAASAGRHRELGIDAKLMTKANRVIVRALSAQPSMTREEIRVALVRARVVREDGPPMSHVMMCAELAGLICSGPRRGRQFTYSLLDERAPAGPSYSAAEAGAVLALRYRRSRGACTAHDFARWAGMTVTAARAAFADTDGDAEVVEAPPAPHFRAHLMSIFDEYISSYNDRKPIFDPGCMAKMHAVRNGVASIAVLDTKVVGFWKRTVTKSTVSADLDICARLKKADVQAVHVAAARYAGFNDPT